MSELGRRIAFILAMLGLLVGCDSGGGPGSNENQAPSVTISAPNAGTEFTGDETITFEGAADDPEDDSLTGDMLTWTSSTDGDFGNGEQVETSSLSAAQHTITLTATDSDGASAEDSISIVVGGPPSASISNPSDETIVDEGTTITLEGSATDPINGELSEDALEWYSDVDGQVGMGESVSVSDLSSGPHTIKLRATDQDGNTSVDSTDILLEAPDEFNVRIRFTSDFTEDQKTTVRDALEPWTTAITGDYAGAFLSSDVADECNLEEGKGIDDLVASVSKQSLDGSGGTLAQAGPCAQRANSTVVAGIVQIDEADLNNPALEQIVTHEIGHVLGIGIEQNRGWDRQVSGLDTFNPSHEGAETTEAFDQLGGKAYLSTGVPLANQGGRGTRGGHWREANFDNELMTGFINDGNNPLSRLSLASLADIGYEMDLSTADSYSLPMPQTTLQQAAADATLSRPNRASENFGEPSGSPLGNALVAGTNADSLWSEEVPEEEAFSSVLRFNVPSSVPSGVTVEGAEFRLIVDDRFAGTTDHDIRAVRVSESWDEGSVTWDTRPTTEQNSIETFDFESCDECRISSTDLVTDWISGNTANNGIALRAPDASSDPTFSVGFVSRHTDALLDQPLLLIGASIDQTAAKAGSERSSGVKTPLGDDIRDGKIFVIGPDNRVVETKRIR